MERTGSKELLIFPCNGNGIEALDCLDTSFRVVGFVDDTAEKQAMPIHGHRVYPRSVLDRRSDALVLAVPGSPTSYRTRSQTIHELGVDAARWATIVHPSARISPLATIGYNVLIMAGVVLTSNAVIGNHVCVLPNTVIHHDARIGDWCLIGSNVTIAGGTTLGENCYVGSGSSIMNGLHIGDRALVGLGSNVIRDASPGSRIAGNPARIIP